MNQRKQLQSLQVIRAFAALIVVLFHLNVHTLPANLDAPRLWDGFNMGYAGVEIFFVLSGFIMLFVHRKDFGKPNRLGAYLYARFTRIYPVLWIVLIGVVLLRFVSNQNPPDLQSMLVSASLLPYYEHHILSVQWTLSFEMLFYLVFSICLLDARLGIAVGALWFGACILLAALGVTGLLSHFIFSPYNILFLIGIICALIWPKTVSIAWPLLIGGTIVFLAVGLSEVLGFVTYNKPFRTVLFGLGAAGMICGAVGLETQDRISVPRFVVFLGDASYAIYLAHLTVLSVVALTLKAVGLAALPSIVLAIIVFLAAVLVGSLLHLLIEKPIIAYFRKKRPQAWAAS